MRVAARLTTLACLLFASTMTFGQTSALSSAGIGAASPGYAQRPPIDALSVPIGTNPSGIVLDVHGAVVGGPTGNYLTNLASSQARINALSANSNSRPNLPTIDGLDTLATFDGSFVAQAGPSSGRDYRFTMIGNSPLVGGTTDYPFNIDEVSLQLLNADGSVFKVVPFTAAFENLTLNSPDFVKLDYRSGANVQFVDAEHRAEFFNVMKNSWHTQFLPKVVSKSTIQVPYTVNVRLSDGTIVTARSYFTGTAADGSTFVLLLGPLFNFFFDNEGVNQIVAGNFTTDAINTTMFPNTYLFDLNVANPNQPGNCCVLGFHTYFLEGGIFPQPRWITQYASWISPGLFGGGFQDVTALSHETSEAVDDPFVDNPTPNWQFPGQPANSKFCQANLEVGDVVEVLANATAATEVKHGKFNYIYHPQNMALYEWFNMGTTSSAIDGSWSFPDETVLPHSALPCPQ